ncbi:MAG: cation diffusion facilitator family transporter [Eubacterium sp.]|nr:cation diffusion facilitator family transporter [Eubacterium sp.]
MTEIIISLFNKKSRRFGGSREGYPVLSGITGLILNALLCIFKLTVGGLSGSVAIIGDGLNNLSDAATNAVTITGARLSAKEGDREHPFGHGRIEYITALIVTFSIFIMSFELGKSSVEKIIHPSTVSFSPFYLIVPGAAVLVKLWMAYFNGKLYKLSDNLSLKAVRQDSLNDCITTMLSAAALIISHFLKTTVADGIIGIIVAVIVLFSGVSLLKEIINPLLGEPPTRELTDEIKAIIMSEPLVTGVHDLIVHSYGAENKIASAHAEVPADSDIVEVHDAIDRAERKIKEKLGIIMCIHIDPVKSGDSELDGLKRRAEAVIKKYDSSFTFHDFRFIERYGKECISFDVVVPFESEKDNGEIRNELIGILSAEFPEYPLDITVEHSYTGE